jgi:hypothetical protein
MVIISTRGDFMKKFVSGLLLGLIIATSIGVFAESRSIEVFFNNIKIAINGDIVPMDPEPFIYSGRTYVPISFVAESFGKEVKFNETTNTVEINDMVQKMYGGEALMEVFDKTVFSNVLDIDESNRQQTFIVKDGEEYLQIMAFAKHYVTTPQGHEFSIPGKEVVVFKHDEFYDNFAIQYNFKTLIKLSALGLKAVVDGDSVTIE